MTALQLVTAPDPIFRKKAEVVDVVDDEIRETVDAMFAVMYAEGALGIGANMVGVLKRICIIDLQEGGVKKPLTLINPEIVEASDDLSEYEEASLSFPGISAPVKRPRFIRVKFLDRDGKEQELEAEVPLSTIIQHEMDYLDGRTYLDHISKIKRDRLLKKMKKFQKFGHAHHHHHGHSCGDPDCGHDH